MSKNLMSVCTILSSLILSLLLCGCSVQTRQFDPEIAYYPTRRTLDALPSGFPPLSENETSLEWGKELFLGLRFAEEFDLYRAITCYKRALYLCPRERKNEIEYHIVEAYYLGQKFSEVAEFYEMSSLEQVPWDFPVLKELLLMLYETYSELGQCAKAARIYCLIHNLDTSLAEHLSQYAATVNADFDALSLSTHPDMPSFLNVYYSEAKSERCAQVLNALLPGAGYYYVGQKKSAVTSFLINALFTYAAYQFFERGYVAAGLITAGLEVGWYVGGINGAGLAARAWNENLYENSGKEFLSRNRLFPVLMFNYAF